MEQEQHKKSVLHSFDHGKIRMAYIYMHRVQRKFQITAVSKHKSNLELEILCSLYI